MVIRNEEEKRRYTTRIQEVRSGDTCRSLVTDGRETETILVSSVLIKAPSVRQSMTGRTGISGCCGGFCAISLCISCRMMKISHQNGIFFLFRNQSCRCTGCREIITIFSDPASSRTDEPAEPVHFLKPAREWLTLSTTSNYRPASHHCLREHGWGSPDAAVGGIRERAPACGIHPSHRFRAGARIPI